ncbi:MAG: ribonuclease P protein component [Anaerolinea sp.]|nr:ribonuclease P protein component [Anaerolinea sp.]
MIVERARRLRKGTEFDTAYREGTVIGGPLLVLRVRANGLGVTRWGFAVGKRIAPLATRRNRAKRVLSEAARGVAVQGGLDIVVTARAASLDASFDALRRAIERALERASAA